MSFHGLSLIQTTDILPQLHNYTKDQNIDIETEILYEYLQSSQEWWSENRYYLGNTSVYIYDPISDKVLQNEEQNVLCLHLFFMMLRIVRKLPVLSIHKGNYFK